MKALTGQWKESFTSGQADEVTFSSLTNVSFGSTINHTSTHQKFTDATMRNQIAIEMNAAVGPGVLTFSGVGKIAASERQSEAALAGGQYSIPGRVTLNTPMLHQWNVQGTSSWVRVNVGGLEGKPEQFRLCWDTNYAGYVRTSCTHHMRSDGTQTGADSNHQGVVHFTNKEAASPRSILRCEYRTTTRDYSPPGNNPAIQTYESYYSMFEFEGLTLFKNRAKSIDFKPPGTDFGGAVGWEQKTLSDGRIENSYYTPRSRTAATRRSNVVEAYEHSFGFVDTSNHLKCDINMS